MAREEQISDVKKTKRFGGKNYRWYRYVTTKSEAQKIAKRLRNDGALSRIVAPSGYQQTGWDIYVR